MKKQGTGLGGLLHLEDLVVMGGISQGADAFADLMSATRLGQMADALHSTPVCVPLFAMMFTGLMFPPG